MIQTHKIGSKDQAQSLTSSFMGDNTIQNKAITLEDNRPHTLLQKKTNTNTTSRSPHAPIQRVVEPYGQNPTYYRSSYQRLVDPTDLELHKTKEEAEKVDEECRRIWESRQADKQEMQAEEQKNPKQVRSPL